ncbi:hypothetical protein [Helicobacter kayseriensis]|nr:hypothetical protein [Helicobacter kayseriensis]MCE3048030.1 hypothetical protein [Helicobacter kayseriensis]
MHEIFLEDYLNNLNNQTEQNFDLLLFLDCINLKTIETKIQDYKNLKQKKVFFFHQEKAFLSPTQIRQFLINKAHKLSYDLLIFSDFDEISGINRVEKTLQQIHTHHFAFNSFFPADANLFKLSNQHFYYQINAPKLLDTLSPLLHKNFIGFGNIALKINHPFFSNFYIPNSILAPDWFLASWMLINNLSGIQIQDTYNLYRQHTESFIGFDGALDEKRLELGIAVKIKHYQHFQKISPIYRRLFIQTLKLQTFLSSKENKRKYIRIINTNFCTSKFCWWENIKMLKEIAQWI